MKRLWKFLASTDVSLQYLASWIYGNYRGEWGDIKLESVRGHAEISGEEAVLRQIYSDMTCLEISEPFQ